MAMADYRQCDVCGCKAFYDANLNYDYPDKNGNDQWGNPAVKVRDSGYTLDHLGDWAVLCIDCAKTHKAVIVPIAEGESK